MPGNGTKKMIGFNVFSDFAGIFESRHVDTEFFMVNDQGSIVPNHDRINDLKQKFSAVVANCATENWIGTGDNSFTWALADLFQQHELNYAILTHDPDDQCLEKKIFYFPWFFWWALQVPNYMTAPNVMSDRQYWVSSLGGQPKSFRIANYLRLQDKSYVSNCLCNIWSEIEWTRHSGDNTTSDLEGLELTALEQAQWLNVKKHLHRYSVDGILLENVRKHPAYGDAFVNLINEAGVKKRVLLTEKTFKPLISGQLFLMLGNPGNVGELRRLGFDVFDDLIDHSYDLETNPRSRLDKLHHALDNLMQEDLSAIYIKSRRRLLDNWHKVRKGDMVREYLDPIKNVIAA